LLHQKVINRPKATLIIDKCNLANTGKSNESGSDIRNRTDNEYL
jgi:hypothetical protein